MTTHGIRHAESSPSATLKYRDTLKYAFYEFEDLTRVF